MINFYRTQLTITIPYTKQLGAASASHACTHPEDKFVSTEYDTVRRSECIGQTGGLPGELRPCERSRIHTDSVHNHPAHPCLPKFVRTPLVSLNLRSALKCTSEKEFPFLKRARTVSLNSVLSSLTLSRNHHDHQPT